MGYNQGGPLGFTLKWLEVPGIDPGTSRMLSERSTIWATPPLLTAWDMWSKGSKYTVFIRLGNTWKQLEVPGTQGEIITGYEWQAKFCQFFRCCHIWGKAIKKMKILCVLCYLQITMTLLRRLFICGSILSLVPTWFGAFVGEYDLSEISSHW